MTSARPPAPRAPGRLGGRRRAGEASSGADHAGRREAQQAAAIELHTSLTAARYPAVPPPAFRSHDCRPRSSAPIASSSEPPPACRNSQ